MESLGGTCECNDAWENWNCTTDRTEAWRCNDGMLESQHCTGPAACTVMPIGTPDECDTSASDPGSDGSDSGSDTGSDTGSDSVAPPGDEGGCSTSGTPGGLAAVAIGLLAIRRRRDQRQLVKRFGS
jgi:MYXO-CTERM domain-containing protein